MKPLEIYIHIPFCIKKCAYCDFLSFPADTDTKNRYVESLISEIRSEKDRKDRIVSTVFFGGGTPSVLPQRQIAAVLETLRENYAFAKDAEISIECNPGTLSAEKLRVYREAGINRLSMGLQSADDAELRLLGRIHTYADFLQSFSLAREAGFSNINVDLMSGLPGQSVSNWISTLEKVLALRPEHISAYGLMIEEGTPFYAAYAEDAARRERGEESVLLPSEEDERRMYHETGRILKERGYLRYEISNYALPGYECRHNIGYWRRAEYRGFGLGAASFLDGRRFADTEDPERYLRGDWAGVCQEALSREEQIEETMFLGLRMSSGVSSAHFEERFGETPEQIYGETLERLERQGLIAREEGRICLTERGIDISNYVLSEFLFSQIC